MIIERVDQLAQKKGVTALSVGATSVPHFDDAVKAVDFTITGKAVSYLEEL